MFQPFFQSKWFTFLALGAIFLLALSLLRMQPQRVVVEKKLKSFQDKISELERSNSELGSLLDYFKTDAYLEREAKLKLNVKRPEEEVVFLNENDTNLGVMATVDSNSKYWSRNYFVSLKHWLINLFK